MVGKGLDVKKAEIALRDCMQIAVDTKVGEMIYKRGEAGAEEAIAVALALSQIKQILNDPPVLKLLRSLIGDPCGIDADATAGDDRIVVDAVTHAICLDFKLIGGEFAIIQKKMFPQAPGYRRKLEEMEGVSRLRVWPEHPTMKAGGTYASVPITVEVTVDGKKMTWDYTGDRSILCRMTKDNKTGADAVIAKAERKALRRVWNELSGMTFGFEEDEEDIIEGEVVVDPDGAVKENIEASGMNEAGIPTEEEQEAIKKQEADLFSKK